MKTDELREMYLDFFKSKDHRVCESDVLVPKWDETVLFTPAGMNPFKDHFLGKVKLEYTRATSCQKCLRTGDIENVGRTAYHHTFFEMLGNFSFGDYFKREAISWAWEFLTDKKWLAIDKNRLTVSVYLDDDQSAGIWRDDVGLSSDRIARLGEHENFWPAGAPTDGPDGVCGPCSEIFFHPDRGGECEIWNLVFTQFNRYGDPPDNLLPLPNKNIDTGMGLERIAATMQGVDTNFHIDTLLPLVEIAAEVCGMKYDATSEHGRRARRIADHVRACTMAIHENVYPDKQKENYVIRRLLRRAVLQGHEMGMREPFVYKLVPKVVEMMARPYPDLKDTADRVSQVVKHEEEGFFDRLDDGLQRIESIFTEMKAANSNTVDGNEAADLYQTFGIPAELFESIAKGQGFQFDWVSYQKAMEDHSNVSRVGGTGVMGDFGPLDEIKREVKTTKFLGYATSEGVGTVRGLIDGQTRVVTLPPTEGDQWLVLDQTPFYAESGGQVGDRGTITGPCGQFEVEDVQKNGGIFVHTGRVTRGTISDGDTVQATVDSTRRDAIRRAHSATHLLHYALQQDLGSHAQQRGSKVVDDWLRFDFANLQGVDDEKLLAIEKRTNEKIKNSEPIRAEILPLEDARNQGAMMLFGEKYPDPVRMVSMGDFSKELCGGTHLENTSQIIAFEILAEESVSSGTRRIEAITGQKAQQNQQAVIKSVEELSCVLGVEVSKIPDSIERLSGQLKDLKKQIASGKRSETSAPVARPTNSSKELDYFEQRRILRDSARQLNVPLLDVVRRVRAMQSDVESLNEQLDAVDSAGEVSASDLLKMSQTVSGIQIIVQHLPNSNPSIMRQLIDQVRKKTSPVALFLATTKGMDKVILVAGISRDLVDKGFSAGDWVKEIAPIVGGGGGGKPDLAQAGGKQPQNLSQALQSAREFMSNQVVS